MKQGIDIMENGYLFRRLNVKFDAIGNRFKITVRKFWIEYYTRKANNRYGIVYKDMSIFITFNTPLVIEAKKNGNDAVVGQLSKYWIDIFDYAMGKSEPKWITYSESEKYSCEGCEKEEVLIALDITSDEFDCLNQRSPYS